MTDQSNFQRLKRVVVKEEFKALTGDFIKAVILNQFIYWSERVQDFDSFIQEEKNRANQEGIEINMEPTNGWIYKKAEELSEETMLGLAANTMHRHVKALVDNGWLIERNNPAYKWDRTKQYRVNLIKIQNDLLELGYILQDYRVDIQTFKKENAKSKMEVRRSIMENGESKMEIGTSEMEFHSSIMENQSFQNGRAIPEITYRDYNTEKNDEEGMKEGTVEKNETTRRHKSEKMDEQIYNDYEEAALHYFRKIGEDESILPHIYQWVAVYGKELVMYMMDRLAEQEKKINNVIRWIEKALKNPEKYPPKISYKKKGVDTNERRKLYDALLMS